MSNRTVQLPPREMRASSRVRVATRAFLIFTEASDTDKATGERLNVKEFQPFLPRESFLRRDVSGFRQGITGMEDRS